MIELVELVGLVAKVVFYGLTYEFTLGGITFSAWNIFITYLVCQLVGYAIWVFIKGVAQDADY